MKRKEIIALILFVLGIVLLTGECESAVLTFCIYLLGVSMLGTSVMILRD